MQAPATVQGIEFPKWSNSFKFKIQTHSNFDGSKIDLPEPQNFEIKYVFEDLKKTKSFLHRNFIFGKDFE
jgi:hypothetical protein